MSVVGAVLSDLVLWPRAVVQEFQNDPPDYNSLIIAGILWYNLIGMPPDVQYASWQQIAGWYFGTGGLVIATNYVVVGSA